jgi:hypothetical protein
MAHRILTQITRLYPMIPPELKRQVKALASADPTFRFPPNLFAQFEVHQTLSEQLNQMNNHALYLQAAALFKAKPAGHA